MNDPAALAAFEEHRLALSLVEVADRAVVLETDEGGGSICSGRPGDWINTAAGLGMWGRVPPSAIDRVIEFHESAGADARIEACPYADPSLLEVAASRGFVLRDYENVLARPLAAADRFERAGIDGVTVVEIARDDMAALEEVAGAITAGFCDDGAPTASAIELTARCARHPRAGAFAAVAAGRVVGAGLYECSEIGGRKSATLFSLSVAAAYRGRGIQAALIAARLQKAAELGCTIATISSRPGVATERNARRAGFTLMYTRAVLARPREGLPPVR
ncbi:MAG: GNAT family N-acetyltransferase [Phycisphaerales bacterium]